MINKKMVIDVNLINDLLADFNSMGYDGESFSDFIKGTTDDEKPVWEYKTIVEQVIEEL